MIMSQYCQGSVCPTLRMQKGYCQQSFTSELYYRKMQNTPQFELLHLLNTNFNIKQNKTKIHSRESILK